MSYSLTDARASGVAVRVRQRALPRYPTVVDGVTVRLIAAVVGVVALAALVTQQWWLYAILAIDFVPRAVAGPALSPIAQYVLWAIRPRVRLAPRPTAGAPKQFAAAIGAALTVAATVLFGLLALGAQVAAGAFVVGGMLVAFPALDALAGICVGCHLYRLLVRIGVARPDVCVDCAPNPKKEP